MRLNTIAKEMEAAGHKVATRRGIGITKVYARNLEFSKSRGEHTIYVFDSNEMEMHPMTDIIFNADGSVHITIIKDGEFVGRDYWTPMRVPKRDEKIRGILFGCMDCFYRKRQEAAGNTVTDCECPKMRNVSRRETKEA